MAAGMAYPGNHREDLGEFGLRLWLVQIGKEGAGDRAAIGENCRLEPA